MLNLAAEKQLVGSLSKRHAVTTYVAPTACKRTVSGSLSPRCPRCFSPFLRSTGSLSVCHPCLALRSGPRCFRQDSSCPALLRIPLDSNLASSTGLSPAAAHLSRCFLSLCLCRIAVLLPQCRLNGTGLGSFLFARHYSGNRCFFLFLRILRCFSSPRAPTVAGV